MTIPDNLKYSTDHEWMKADGDILTLGITEFAQSELGDIVFLEFPEVGSDAVKGDPFGTVEAVKTVADLLSPVNGEIVEINEDLNDSPEEVNSDPYGKGWMVKIKMSDVSEFDGFMNAAAYKEFIG